VALLVLAVEAGAPSVACASCGDYVLHGKQTSHADHSLAPAAPDETPSGQERTPPATPRCHGPSCNPGNLPPASPTAPQATASKEWGSLPVVPIASPGDARPCPLVDFHPAPRDSIDDIFHPPRSYRSLSR